MPSAKKKSHRSQPKSKSQLKDTVSRQTARPAELQYTPWSAVPLEEVHPLFHRQFVVGQEIMLSRILMKKGFVVPEHSHHNEQLTYILDGALKFWIDGKEIVVKAGETLCIPSNMPHKAEALEDTIDLDVFSPPRADWVNKTDQYLRKK
jgi:quercetin dioxygenase-like cupin family protein